MMNQDKTIVVVGAGTAGTTAAFELREQGFAGQVTLLSDEPDLPYERPPLSKAYLAGEQSRADLLTRPQQDFSDHGIDLRLSSRAVAVDPEEGQLLLNTGETITYDQLLLTTGSRNRRIPVPGLDLPGVYDLRTRADSDRIRVEAGSRKHAVVLGMGFIGSEIASTLNKLGVKVTVVEMLSAPLVNTLGAEISRAIADIHSEHGVNMLFDTQVSALEGEDRVERVITSDGRRIECDFVVFGFGTEPNVELAELCGCKIQTGIVVDEYGSTSVPGIFAAGDVAMHYHPVAERHLRVEHWQHAILHSKSVARNMLGSPSPYDDVHWFWSNQYDDRIHYAGFHGAWTHRSVSGTPSERKFCVYYFNEESLVGVAAVNQPMMVREAMPLLAERATSRHPAIAGTVELL